MSKSQRRRSNPTRLHGREAIAYATRHARTLHKYADPTEGARDGVTIADAETIAAEDPGLIWIEPATRPARARTITSKAETIDRDGEPVAAFTFRMRTAQLRALQAVQADSGIPITQQLRRAIDLWLQTIEADQVPGVRQDAPRLSLKPKHATTGE